MKISEADVRASRVFADQAPDLPDTGSPGHSALTS
jgi:hypothetical protein